MPTPEYTEMLGFEPSDIFKAMSFAQFDTMVGGVLGNGPTDRSKTLDSS
jgi:hypothetical protein